MIDTALLALAQLTYRWSRWLVGICRRRQERKGGA